jgi:signal peptidase I
MHNSDATAKQSDASASSGNTATKTILAKLGIDRSLFWTILVIVLLRTMVVGHFVIPSGSMLPTLKLGDHVVVNELAYGLHLPLMKRNLFNWAEPVRGEIIVFPHPAEGTTLIKRVIGIAGDEIRYDAGRLVVNDQPVDEQLVQDPGNVLADLGEDIGPFTLYREILPGGHKHWVLRGATEGFTYRDQRRWKVPPGHVFVSGDNRDNSVDSRFWGFVPVEAIYGPALFLSYSTIPNSGLLPRLRVDRFFAKLDQVP